MKISELKIGALVVIPLVVLSATARETKAKKPYLSLEFYDGESKINGNYWDWAGKAIPGVNAILNVSAQVTEWQGVKQLSVQGLATNTELHISEFMPASGLNVPEIYKEAYQLASDIDDYTYRTLCLSILDEYRDLWLSAPAAIAAHHAYTAGTLIHSLSVAKLARAIAENIEGADVSLATAGGLLHDVGKLFGYAINGLACEMTDAGKLFDHLFIGAELVGKNAETLGLTEPLPGHYRVMLLRHVILSHHGSQEHGAVVPPVMLEAHVVFHADSLDAAAEMIRDAGKRTASPWTDKIWFLGNRPHLSAQVTLETLSSD